MPSGKRTNTYSSGPTVASTAGLAADGCIAGSSPAEINQTRIPDTHTRHADQTRRPDTQTRHADTDPAPTVNSSRRRELGGHSWKDDSAFTCRSKSDTHTRHAYQTRIPDTQTRHADQTHRHRPSTHLQQQQQKRARWPQMEGRQRLHLQQPRAWRSYPRAWRSYPRDRPS
jgi:hypothetical protein